MHSSSAAADTLQLAEYALKAKNNSLSFFCSVPTICLQSALCVVHCVVTTLEMLEKVFQPLPSIVRRGEVLWHPAQLLVPGPDLGQTSSNLESWDC